MDLKSKELPLLKKEGGFLFLGTKWNAEAKKKFKMKSLPAFSSISNKRVNHSSIIFKT
jgi:hypothetical protein